MVYGVASLLFYAGGIRGGQIFMAHGDSLAYIWFLKWWPFAVSNNLDPFITGHVWSPIGFNMLWATSIPTLAFLAWPVTAAISAETSWNILCLAAPALNACAAYLLIDYLVRDRIAACLGGFIFGFSPYVTGHMLGHVSLSFVPLVPIAALLGIQRARRSIGRRSYVICLSLLVVLQFGISMEVLATTAMFAGIAYALLWSGYRHSADMKGLAIDTGAAAAVCLAVLWPAFRLLLIGAEQTPDVLNSPLVFSNDLLNFIVPSRTMLLGGQAFEFLSSTFTANASEQDAYIGVPLIVLAAVAFAALRHERWAKPLAVMTLIAVVASLGPSLWIGGRIVGIPMPWATFDVMPLIRHALPARLALYTSLGIAVLIGAWLSRRPGRTRYAAALVGILFIVPNPSVFSFVSYASPAVFAHADDATKINSLGPSVVLPFGSSGNATLWQVRSDMRFKMVGGYIGFTPRYFALFPATRYFSSVGVLVTDDEFKRDMLAFCLANSVGSIVLTSGTPRGVVERLRDLKWRSEVVGNSEVIIPPATARDDPFLRIYGDVGESPATQRRWLGKMTVVVNNQAVPTQVTLTRGATPYRISPVAVTVITGDTRIAHLVGTAGALISVPPYSHIIMIADRTWVPADHALGPDQRNLSVFADIVTAIP